MMCVDCRRDSKCISGQCFTVLSFTQKVNLLIDIVVCYRSLNKLSRKLLSCFCAGRFGEKRYLCVVMFCTHKEGKTYRLASTLKYR